jgi:hypothetical protein
MNYERACNVTGPWTALSSAYERQVHCNRVQGHEGTKHREYDPRTFKVIAEWETPSEPDPRQRRKKEEQPSHGSK